MKRGDRWVKIEKPDDARAGTFGDQILLTLRSDWNVQGKLYAAGSLLAMGFDDFLKGGRGFSVLFEPAARKSLAGVTDTKNFLIVNELDNVRNRRIVDPSLP